MSEPVEFGRIVTFHDLPDGAVRSEEVDYRNGHKYKTTHAIKKHIRTDNRDVIKHITDSLMLLTQGETREITISVKTRPEAPREIGFITREYRIDKEVK